MSRPTYEEYMAEFRKEVAENDPMWLVHEHLRINGLETRAHTDAVNEAIAGIGRASAKLEEAPVPLKAWVEGERPTLGGGK